MAEQCEAKLSIFNTNINWLNCVRVNLRKYICMSMSTDVFPHQSQTKNSFVWLLIWSNGQRWFIQIFFRAGRKLNDTNFMIEYATKEFKNLPKKKVFAIINANKRARPLVFELMWERFCFVSIEKLRFSLSLEFYNLMLIAVIYSHRKFERGKALGNSAAFVPKVE